jgi:SAM-dependent methyltransferase
MTNEEYVNNYAAWVGEDPYFATHARRFRQTLDSIPHATAAGMRAIEVGTYGFFLKAMRSLGGYDRVDGAIFEAQTASKILTRSYDFDPDREMFTLYNANLESECLPMEEGQYDLLLAPEILEHMPVDPVGFMQELNRILKQGGRIILTTPNACCAENIFRILWRQVPNTYYFYRSGRHQDRHNLEYGPDLLMKLMKNCGFEVERIWTEYSWFPERPELVEWIDQAGYPTELRGDNLFVQAVKTGDVVDRFPSFLYD